MNTSRRMPKWLNRVMWLFLLLVVWELTSPIFRGVTPGSAPGYIGLQNAGLLSLSTAHC